VKRDLLVKGSQSLRFLLEECDTSLKLFVLLLQCDDMIDGWIRGNALAT